MPRLGDDEPVAATTSWKAKAERGSAALIHLIAWLARAAGRPLCRALLYPIVLYFVVTDGTQVGLATAAHCPDQLDYIEPGGGELPLTMIGAWGARYQDVQIHLGGQAFAPLFFADKGKTVSRPVTSWRNRASTRSGDLVCHRGERTGYSCAEVLFVDYAPPGDLCAGPCEPTWVAVRGPTCKGGDSGGPVFSGSIAFGLVKGSSYTGDGRCRLYYYMSTDYLPPGWTVAVQSGIQAPQN
jgi:hypothetical protein